ncbi:hypothetical protein D9M72_570340 [compost metagenome]
MNRTGTGPESFSVRNTTGTTSTAVSGKISVTPKVAGTANPLVGIHSFTTGTLTEQAMTAGVFSAKFSLTSGVGSNSMVIFPMGFYYTGNKQVAARDFIVEITFTSPTGLVIPSSGAELKLGAP